MTNPKIDAEACVMRLLARRDHSTGELRAKLKQRDFDKALIEEVIADLVEHGWVNDKAFATHQAELLVARGWGPIQIRKKLTNHGVDHDLAANVIDDLDVDWVEAARDRVQRKFGELERGQQEKAFRHLTYRGFPADSARRAIFD